MDSSVTHFSAFNTTSVNSDLATITPTTTVNGEGRVFEHGVAILYGIFAFVGIFVLLFATFLGVYVYKQCCRRSILPEQYGTTNQSQSVRYDGLVVQTRKENEPIDINESLSTDPMYLDPVCARPSHSVDIESDDIEIQPSVVERNSQTSSECNNTADNSAYLTPDVKDSHTYVEILDKPYSL